MNALRFWLPLPNGVEQEIIIAPEYVQSVMIPAAEHEAGHIIAAYHYSARVLGIAVGFIPERHQRGMFLQAIYASKGWSVETQCIVKAAGPAADILYQGKIDDKGASGDLRDIEALTGRACLEPHLTRARNLLSTYPAQFKCIAQALYASFESTEERILGRLPDNRIGAMLLNESQLMACLQCV